MNHEGNDEVNYKGRCLTIRAYYSRVHKHMFLVSNDDIRALPLPDEQRRICRRPH